jgi:hypothetical protein
MQPVTDLRADSGRRVPTAVFIVIIGGAILLMLVAIVVVATVVLRRVSPSGSDRTGASLAITLTATSTGTEVTLVIASVGGDRLPDRLDLQLTPHDQGINEDGGPFTDASLAYNDFRDDTGHHLATGNPRITVREVPTDGMRAAFSFSVARAGGRRVVYPIPYSSAVRFSSITVTGAQPSSCLQSSGLENGRLHFFPCTIDPSGTVNYSGGRWAPESIRLELAG